MSARLVIRLSAGAEPGAEWLLLDPAAGESRYGRTEAPDLLPDELAHRATRVDLVLPGAEILGRRVELPARTEAQARAAIGYLLEDDLADPPDMLHFALGRTGEDGRRSICAVSRERMASWLSTLAGLGFEPDHMVPDYLLLGAGPGEAVIAEEGGMVVVALGPDTGFALEAELARLVLGEALNEAEIERVRVHSAAPEAIAPEAGWGERVVETAPARDGESALRQMARGVDRAAVDLRQGNFARRRGLAADARKALAGIAALAGLLAVAGAMLLYLEGARYSRLAETADARIERVFRAALPEAGRIVNPSAQLAAARARLDGGAGGRFLDLADMLAASIAANQGMRLVSLRYADGEKGLRAELVYRDFADLDAIKASVAARGGRLEESGARQEGGRVIGSVVLERAQ